jgi:hypothetical protein
MCVLIFFSTSIWNISNSKKKCARCYHERTEVFISSTHYSYQILIFLTDFQGILKYHIAWKSIQWELSCSMRTDRHMDRWLDRHDEADNYFFTFCNHTKKTYHTYPNAEWPPNEICLQKKIILLNNTVHTQSMLDSTYRNWFYLFRQQEKFKYFNS